MTIQQCRYVLEIARCGSFSEAAKQLFIAQSSLSVGVKSLETELNIQIFDRSGTGVYLTDEGAEFIKYARQICQNSELITQRYDRNIRQKLYIATQHYDFIADLFTKLLQQTESESYRFSIREIETYRVIRDVQTAYSDIGIMVIKDSNQEIIALLRQRSRPYLFSNTLAPAVAAGSLKVLEILEKDLSMREKLFENTRLFAQELKKIGLDVIDRGAPILPVMLYDEHVAVEMAKRMMEKGVYVVAFSYPVVPKGKARIRTQLSAALSREDILYIARCFREVKEDMGI